MGAAAVPLMIGATVLSTGLGAIQARNQGIAAQQQANYEAEMDQLQGKIAQNQAIAQQNQLDAEAAQAKTNAGQERAASQQRAIIAKKKSDLVISSARATSAAGGSSLDPSVVAILGDLTTEGDYNALSAMYEGEDAARNMEDYANLRTYEGKLVRQSGVTQSAIYDASSSMRRTAGKNYRSAGNMAAFSTVLSGAKDAYTMYDKYGNNSSYR